MISIMGNFALHLVCNNTSIPSVTSLMRLTWSCSPGIERGGTCLVFNALLDVTVIEEWIRARGGCLSMCAVIGPCTVGV